MLQKNELLNQFYFVLLKFMSLSNFFVFKVKAPTLKFSLLQLRKYYLLPKSVLSNKKAYLNSLNFLKSKAFFESSFSGVKEKKIKNFLSIQKQKQIFLFFFQFLKKLKSHHLDFKHSLYKKNIQLYENYNAGFYLSNFIDKNLGKKKKK